MKEKAKIGTWTVIAFMMVFSAAGFSQEGAEPQTGLGAGIAAFESGDYERSIDILKALIRKEVDKDILSKAHIYLAYISFSQGKTAEAKSNIDKILQYRPSFSLDEYPFPPGFVDLFKSVKELTVGIAFLESTPSNARVYIEREMVGHTPIKVELLSQTYTLKLVKAGYSPIEKKIDVTKNDIRNFKIYLGENKYNWKTFSQSVVIMTLFTILIKSI